MKTDGRAALVVVAVLVLAMLGARALIGLGSGGDDDSEPSANRRPAATTTLPPTTAAPVTPVAVSPPIEDGRHAVYLTGIDTGAGTVEFDLVQWLTDDAAVEYIEAHPDAYPGHYEEIQETGVYPWDELVVNENPRLRTLPVAPDTQAMVLMQPNDTMYPYSVPFAELPGYFDQTKYHDDKHLSVFVFWLTVHDGEIVAMEEQFQS